MKYGFFIFMFSVLTILSAYVSVRGFQALKTLPVGRYIFLFLLLTLFLLFIGNVLLVRDFASCTAKVLGFIGFSFLIILIYLTLSFLLIDMVRLLNKIIGFAPQGMYVFRQWSFLVTLGILAVVMITGNYAFNHPSVEQLSIRVENKPVQNRRLKIVLASDLHLGLSIDKKNLQKYVELINAQHPDMVLFAGDMVDNIVKPVIEQQMSEEFNRIHAPLGVFAISGNHEYYGENPYLFENYLKENTQVQFLRDTVVLIDDSFYLVGRDDRTNLNRKKINEIVAGTDKDKPFVLLDHQPVELEESEQNGIDLQLSGHTHNGQFFPGNLLVRGMYENPYGYSKKTHTHYYVTSGLGLWGPKYRIGTASEIVVIDFNY
ncbi:MAG: metallophosphoesterase [Prevotellaceae bacterium]|jgi:predicted MPP superfamily phosphohydrolase|nr:metallophosphoesterase [Prevotellaceae bacterium]